MIHVQCPRCNQYLTASEEQAGTMISCRHCGAWVSVPRRGAASGEEEASVACPLCLGRILIRASDIGIPIGCPHCRQMLRAARDTTSGRLILLVGDAEGAGGPVPWEKRKEIGFWRAIWDNFKEIAFAPTAFFRRMRPLGLGDALLFAVTLSLLVALGSVIVQALVYAGFGHFELAHMPPLGMPQFNLTTALLGVLLAPIGVIVGVFIHAALAHLMMLATGGANTAFETTCRVLAYSEAVGVFALIPVCGGLIAPIWFFAVATVGLREVNRISTGRALLAVLAPIFLLGICFCGLLFVLLGVARVTP